MKTSKYEKNYWLTVSLKNTSEELKDMVSFVSLNVEILEHVFRKIDKHTLAFDNPLFKDEFKKSYQNDSELKHLMEHPAIIKTFFILKKLLGRLKTMIHSKKSDIVDE